MHIASFHRLPNVIMVLTRAGAKLRIDAVGQSAFHSIFSNENKVTGFSAFLVWHRKCSQDETRIIRTLQALYKHPEAHCVDNPDFSNATALVHAVVHNLEGVF